MEILNNIAYPKATAMIVQTKRAKDIMQNKYGLKDIRVVSNAVKPMNISNRLRENTIITVGRLNQPPFSPMYSAQIRSSRTFL